MSAATRRDRRNDERRQQRRGTGGHRRGVSQLWVALGVVAGVIALVLIGRAAGVFDPPAASTLDVGGAQYDPAGQTIGVHMPDLGNAHIPTGQSANYPSLPPTSGAHYAQPAGPAPWGVKSTHLPFEVTTHNLEHGGIVIVYRDLTSAELDQLKALVSRLGSSGFNKIILEPYADLQGGKVALTAWNWILKLPTVDETNVIKFVRQHTDDEAPEKGVP